jgi:hypothetical protein
VRPGLDPDRVQADVVGVARGRSPHGTGQQNETPCAGGKTAARAENSAIAA